MSNSQRRLLLLSNSRDPAGNFLKHSRKEINEFLGPRRRTLLFVPYAAVTTPWNEYHETARVAFADMGYELMSIHDARDPLATFEHVQAIVVGGGNTFHLLAQLQRRNLLDVIRERATDGLSYIGWSAGSVLACPTI